MLKDLLEFGKRLIALVQKTTQHDDDIKQLNTSWMI